MKNVASQRILQVLAEGSPVPERWSDVADDPNDVRALAGRARTLRAAWREPIADRAEFIVERCRGKRVMDLGCVAHDVERMKSPDWLHGRVAAAAASCLGVDVLPEGVARMVEAGYDVVAHDLTQGPGPLADAGPFDVIVAGELIEHVTSLDMLFTAARDLLGPQGELLITTPNPWAPHRVAAGQRGDCWENADHIMFAFPSGIAELASAMASSWPRPRRHRPSHRRDSRSRWHVRCGAGCGGRPGCAWASPPADPRSPCGSRPGPPCPLHAARGERSSSARPSYTSCVVGRRNPVPDRAPPDYRPPSSPAVDSARR